MTTKSQCEGKERFETYTVADRVAVRRNKGGRKGRPYRCCFCAGFHIGLPFGGQARRAGFRLRRREAVEA